MDLDWILLRLLAYSSKVLDELAAGANVSEQSVRERLGALRSCGHVEADGGKYRIAQKGRAALAERVYLGIVSVMKCSVLDAGTECVVNASNESATLGGGVSHALREECGPALQAEMKEGLRDGFNGVLDEGDCLVTTGGESKRISRVLHVPSVDYGGTKARLDHAGRAVRTVTSPARVRACTEAALREAVVVARDAGRPTSVAFPVLGAGSGGLAPEVALAAMIDAVRAFLAEDPAAPVERIVFAVPEADRYELAVRSLRRT